MPVRQSFSAFRDTLGATAATSEVHARRAAAVDLAILIAFMTSLNLATLAMTERYAGPITASCTIALITVLLRRRGMRWCNLGMRSPSSPLHH